MSEDVWENSKASKSFTDAYMLYFVLRNKDYLKKFSGIKTTLKDLRNSILKNINEKEVNEILKQFHTDIRNFSKIEFFTVEDMKKNIEKDWRKIF